MKINTRSVHFNADKKLVAFAEKKFTKLTNYFGNIIQCDISLKLENSGRIKDKIVEVKMSLPKTTLFVRENTKTFEASIDLAANTLKRQLKKCKETMKARQMSA